ncbi:hypothetical protein CPB85DRAFT_1433500 [Mucidula mucida]|nr:hypothetical protein CPB85DRAFT_1433500 [Mucidula mucida]
MPSTRVKIRPSQPMHIAVPVAEPGPLPTSALRAGDTRFPFLPPPRSTALLRKAETALMTAATVSPLPSLRSSDLNSLDTKFGSSKYVDTIQRANESTVPTSDSEANTSLNSSFVSEGGKMNFDYVKMRSRYFAPLNKEVSGHPESLPGLDVEQTSVASPNSDMIDVHLLRDRPSSHIPSSSDYVCLKCEKSFRFKESLYQHQEDKGCRHPTGLSCVQCHEVFPSLPKLRVHGNVHPAAISYSCWECDKLFAARHTLRPHVKTHKRTRNTAVMCKSCCREFGTKEDVQQHQRAKRHFGMQTIVRAPPTSVVDVLVLAPHAKTLASSIGVPAVQVSCASEELATGEHESRAQSDAQSGAIAVPATRTASVSTFGCDQCSRSFPEIGRLDQHRQDAHKPKDSPKEKENRFEKTEILDMEDEHTYLQCALCAGWLCGRKSYIEHHMETHPPRELSAKEWQFLSESHSTSSSGFSSLISSVCVFISELAGCGT